MKNLTKLILFTNLLRKINLSIFFLTISLAAFSQTPRLSLYEEFTGENCPPCASANPPLNLLLASPTNTPKIVAIKWQVPIPSAPSNTWSLYQTNKVEIDWRWKSVAAGGYGYIPAINSAPSGKIDGQAPTVFGAVSGHPANLNNTVISTAQSYTSAFSISVTRAWVSSCSSINLTVSIAATANFNSVGALKFRTVMVENIIDFPSAPGSNGETHYEDVAIKSFPTLQSGISMASNWITGQTQTFTLNCPIPSYTRKKEEIAFVGFIQDDGNQRIAQATRVSKAAVPSGPINIISAGTNSLGAICSGNSVTLTTNAVSNYSWSNGSTSNSIVVSPTITTNYSLSATSSLACTGFTTSSLIVNLNPTITVNNGTICAGQNFTINPNGANTYTILGGNAVVNPPSNANYTVVGTSTAGCISQAVSNISVTPGPTITVNNGAVCAGQNFTINPNGANTYTIQGGSSVVSPSISTNYTVAGTSTAGCVSQAFATSSIIVNASPSITVNNGSICVGQNFTINPNGANTFTIQGGNWVVSPSINTSYTVAGTSTAGCVSQVVATSSLIVNPNPTVSISGASGICSGQNASLTANGATNYTWSTGSTSASIITTPTANTTYTLIGSTPQGCSSSTTQLVTVQSSLSISILGPTVVCYGQAANLSGLGGVTYTWNTGAFTSTVAPTLTTTTTFSLIGASGICLNTASTTISVIPNPIITVNNGAICAGQNFTINPNGANTYTIQGGSFVVSPSINTTYTVIGTSTAGCVSQAVASISLIVNQNPIITVNSGTICAGQNFTINPNGANTYTIQGGNAVVSPAGSTSYTVVGTSTAGCLSQAFATSSLIVNANPSITVNSGAICAGQTFTINPNGANTYTIQGGIAVVSPTINSTYTVAGTSTAGCISQAVATSSLIVNANPTITVNSGAICLGESFTLSPNGANTYTIQGGSAVVSPSINTNYTVVGSSTAGCISQAVATSSLTVNLCVGISNQNMGLGGVAIYPNPTNGEFTIESQLAIDLLIINELGQTIKTIQLSNANNLQLKVSDLANGIYFIVGKNKTTNINQKIIVNK